MAVSIGRGRGSASGCPREQAGSPRLVPGRPERELPVGSGYRGRSMSLGTPQTYGAGMDTPPSDLPAGAFIAELSHRAPLEGGNTGVWPGLTIYRFTSPTGPSWEEIQSLSLCIVAQGRKAVTVDGATYEYDPFHYLVLNSHLHFQAEILEATPAKPFLSFVLQIDPSVVREVTSDMLERRTTTFRQHAAENEPTDPPAFVSALDQELAGAVLRFLSSIDTGADRRVLAPMYLKEMVYRVLQREQYARLLDIAAAEAANNPVSAVLKYVQEHLTEPLTVADLAEQVSLSPSAFAHLFREVTGRSPYQFVKEMRLDRARELLIAGRLAVARVSKEVGYGSVSHFLSEFRARFGLTPRAYTDAHALSRELRCRRDDQAAAHELADASMSWPAQIQQDHNIIQREC